jgi:hypothetical protein
MKLVATLDRTERWMQRVVTHPLGVDAGIRDAGSRQFVDVSTSELESMVNRSRNLTATERMAIYHDAYFARFVECLQNDFPIFRKAVGDDAFRQFALQYIAMQPSRGYTLGRFGDGFVDFLRETCPACEGIDASGADWPEFLIELARFERIIAEVFDGPGIEDRSGLDAASLRTLAPRELSQLRFIGAPCLRLLQTQFAVHDWVRQDPDLALLRVLQRRDTCVVITRSKYRVIWQEVECDEFQLLQQLVDGASLGDALLSAASNASADVGELASRLQAMFCRWAALRLFVGVA